MADNAPVNQETIDRIAEAAAAAGPNVGPRPSYTYFFFP